MITPFEIPLQVGTPQTLTVDLGGTTYKLTVLYRNTTDGGWTLDIDDAFDNPVVHGIPFVTGADLLGQYPHMNFGGGLFVQTANDPDAVPTFSGLGSTGLLYWVPSS